jgi:hypothetical protein
VKQCHGKADIFLVIRLKFIVRAQTRIINV